VDEKNDAAIKQFRLIFAGVVDSYGRFSCVDDLELEERDSLNPPKIGGVSLPYTLFTSTTMILPSLGQSRSQHWTFSTRGIP